jgi:hypothetical protein
LQAAVAFQSTVAICEIRMLVVLGDHDPVRRDELGLREKAQGLFIGTVMRVGRIKKAEIAGHSRRIEQPQRLNGLALMDLKPLSYLQGAKILADYASGLGVILSEVHSASPPAQRLNPHCSGAGKQVYPDGILDLGSHNIEQGLSKTIGGGSRFWPAGRDELSAAICTCDDAHWARVAETLPLCSNVHWAC